MCSFAAAAAQNTSAGQRKYQRWYFPVDSAGMFA
jgi:hypothetical protein